MSGTFCAAKKNEIWERVLAWQKTPLTQEDHDHEFKNINNHDHDNHDLKKINNHDHDRVIDGPWLYRQVTTDRDIQQAVSWGVYPQAMYRACERLGLAKVKETIMLVRNYTGVRNRAAYLMTLLKNK
jgi:hypothetical protein